MRRNHPIERNTTMFEALINTNPAALWLGIGLVVSMLGLAVARIITED